MIGSGLYLDDIDKTVAALDGQVMASITETLVLIACVAAFGLALIGVCGIAMNLSQHRVACNKLRLMAHQVVRSQEDERAHLPRNFLDGVTQTLMSFRLMMECAIDRHEQASTHERFAAVGGRCNITSDGHGTEVIAPGPTCVIRREALTQR